MQFSHAFDLPGVSLYAGVALYLKKFFLEFYFMSLIKEIMTPTPPPVLAGLQILSINIWRAGGTATVAKGTGYVYTDSISIYQSIIPLTHLIVPRVADAGGVSL